MFGDPAFWSGFWPNFWADLIVGVLITSVIGWFYRRTHSLSVRVAALTIDKAPQTRVKFSVHNVGGRVLGSNEAYYTLWVSSRLQPSVSDHGTQYPPYQDNVHIYGQSYLRLDALVTGPTFPHARTSVVEVQLNTNKFADADFLWSLSTVDGRFPKPPFLVRAIGRMEANEHIIPGKPEWVAE